MPSLVGSEMCIRDRLMQFGRWTYNSSVAHTTRALRIQSWHCAYTSGVAHTTRALCIHSGVVNTILVLRIQFGRWVCNSGVAHTVRALRIRLGRAVHAARRALHIQFGSCAYDTRRSGLFAVRHPQATSYSRSYAAPSNLYFTRLLDVRYTVHTSDR